MGVFLPATDTEEQRQPGVDDVRRSGAQTGGNRDEVDRAIARARQDQPIRSIHILDTRPGGGAVLRGGGSSAGEKIKLYTPSLSEQICGHETKRVTEGPDGAAFSQDQHNDSMPLQDDVELVDSGEIISASH